MERGRMRVGLFVVLGVLAVYFCLFNASIPTAKADPHAVFYTAIGQQQLFFNMLAALDQADFVEPASGTNSRQELLDKRAQAGFKAEQNSTLNKTRSDLSSILTRSITLEGNDLWSAYLSQQLAIETARRNANDELERIFCERGLGRVGCSDKAGPSQQQDKAFVTNPLKRAAEVAKASYDVFQSGTAADQEIRKKLADSSSDIDKRPRMFDSYFAQLRQNANTDLEKQAVERLASAGANTGSVVDPTALDNLTTDNNGDIAMGGSPTLEDYIGKMATLVNNTQGVLSTAVRAQEQMKTFQEYEESTNAVADIHLKANSNSSDNKVAGINSLTNEAQAASGGLQYRTVSGIIDTPASAKIAMVNELAAGVSRQVTDLKYANPQAITDPGKTESVERSGSTQGAMSTNGNQSSTSSQSGGQVQGMMDSAWQASGMYELFGQKLYGKYDEKKQNSISPDDNLIDPKLEEGSRDALKALTNDTFRAGDPNDSECGFCVDLDNILWQLIQLLNYAKSAFCNWFPFLPICE